MYVSVTRSCLTLCDPMDCSLPGSSVHGISQARILEWTAISFSRDLPNPGVQLRSPALQADSLPYQGDEVSRMGVTQGKDVYQARSTEFTLFGDLRGFPGDTGGRESACQCRRCKRHGFDP